MAIKPKLSILLPAMFGYERTRPALETWLAQSSLKQLEVLLLLPTQFSLSQDEASQLPPICKVVSTGKADLHEARAIGIQVAAGEYIVMAEDHCLPDAGWTEAVLQRLEQGWDAIGSAMRPGNREDCWSEASFLVGYGEWMIPLSGGPTNVLCGWNGTVRTALLRQFGDSLGSEMLIGAFMMKKLQEQGSRFYIEKNAEMRHFDPPGCALNSKLMFIVGLGFGALRTESWAWPLRILYAFALPLIATLHFKRAWVSYVRAGKGCRLRRSVIPASFVLAFAWAIGEAVGAVSSRRRVSPHLWKTEVKPVSQEWIDRSDAEEKRLGNIT